MRRDGAGYGGVGVSGEVFRKLSGANHRDVAGASNSIEDRLNTLKRQLLVMRPDAVDVVELACSRRAVGGHDPIDLASDRFEMSPFVPRVECDPLVHDLADDPADGRIVAIPSRPRLDHHLDPFRQKRPHQAIHAVAGVKVGRRVESDRVDTGIEEWAVEADEAAPASALTRQGPPAEAETAKRPKLQRQPSGSGRASRYVGSLRRLPYDQR